MYPYNIIYEAIPNVNLMDLHPLDKLEEVVQNVANSLAFFAADGDEYILDSYLESFCMKFIEYYEDDHIIHTLNLDPQQFSTYVNAVISAIQLPSIASQLLKSVHVDQDDLYFRNYADLSTSRSIKAVELLEALQIYTIRQFSAAPYRILCNVMGNDLYLAIRRAIARKLNPRVPKRKLKKHKTAPLDLQCICEFHEDSNQNSYNTSSYIDPEESHRLIAAYFESIPYTHVIQDGEYIPITEEVEVQVAEVELEDQSALFHSYYADMMNSRRHK